MHTKRSALAWLREAQFDAKNEKRRHEHSLIEVDPATENRA
jgi:hypothetical protein